MKNDQKGPAIEAYRKSLAFNPGNANATGQIAILQAKRNADYRIDSYGAAVCPTSSFVTSE